MLTHTILNQVHTDIPRPEFPRPDWERTDWLNLNGEWSFRFGADNEGAGDSPHLAAETAYDLTITVPFSWASPLSGIGQDRKGTGWYRRTVAWAPVNPGDRVFLRFGAVDYHCDVWVNGSPAGSHQGGYGTFEFDVTALWRTEADNTIVIRAEDNDLDVQARGKQGYGESRGIWQPVWLEARPQSYIQHSKFHTAIDGTVSVQARIVSEEAQEAELEFDFDGGAVRHRESIRLEAGENRIETSFRVESPRLWSPDSPELYEGEIRLSGNFGQDLVRTYFGIREIGTARFGERGYRWITLNGKPIYLNGTLDQSYHETGYFTFPSDEDMRHEIYMLKRIGLNFVRIHIKPEEPRKLYWADKLGVLVMEDMPCFWGNPDEQARSAYESEALETIERDYNHPSVFSWVMFNETWGLKTDPKAAGLTGDGNQGINYLPDTQEWVRGIYQWAKRLDPTRIVEDNSPCNRDHVETDINTWHFYINGYDQLRAHVTEVVEQTYPGSAANYIGGNVQSDAPLMNSECGNVWGVEGGTGDSDLAWHYHFMLNEFRRHDKMCGFVFTELRDVTNEFNGYYRLDGTDKDFGYDGIVPGMSLSDLHTADFVVIDAPPCTTVDAGSVQTVSLLRSSYDDRYHGQPLRLEWELAYDRLGTRIVHDRGSAAAAWDGYGVAPLDPVQVQMPAADAVAVFAVQLVDAAGNVITRNFTTFDVRSGQSEGAYGVSGLTLSVPVADFAEQTFAHQWNSIQNHKVSGGEEGAFAFDISLPGTNEQPLIGRMEILFEASSKRLLVRNKEGAREQESGIHFMHGALSDPEYNPNTYYMTGERKHESRVRVLIDGEAVATIVLPDDPADSRGVLSWHYQLAHNKLEEAGSYGYLCKVEVPSRIASRLNGSRKFRLELQADEGGIALYGRNAGRYPLDIVIQCQ
ncbi:glycoside hydrolase family 2 protein [Paenibacillus sp. XY044]|uniref:glycoside hydrolase family 2 protein n=1 Tax=Paenibacillus sp. XY044 TaxID=2026089 RepID=UPI00269F51AE